MSAILAFCLFCGVVGMVAGAVLGPAVAAAQPPA
jgi:hypothetical protein